MAERILVIQLKRIGDFILTVPALAQIKVQRPDAEVTLVVPEGLVELAKSLPMVDVVMGFKAGKPNLKVWKAALAGGWAACLDFSGTDRAALLTRLSRAKLRVGYQKFAGTGLRRRAYHRLCAASVRDLHTVDFHLALVGEAFGKGEVENGAVGFAVDGVVKKAVAEKLRAAGGGEGPYVILHPGTARVEKFWMDEQWAEVAEVIRGRFGREVVLTGTGTGLEEAPIKAIKKKAAVPLVDLTGKLSLVEMVAVIEQADLVVGVDSMAMHLTALAQRPQVALFGPTNPYHWRARHARSKVLQGASGRPITEFSPKAPKASMNELSTQAVVDAMASLL